MQRICVTRVSHGGCQCDVRKWPLFLLTEISNLHNSEVFHLNDQQQVWTRPAGVVSKVDYGNSENMLAVIAPSGASSVSLQFIDFHTEQNYDFLTVRSCTAVDCVQTSLLGRFSGSTIPGLLTSGTGIMLIQWTTDEITTYSGWSASWSSVIVGGSLRLWPLQKYVQCTICRWVAQWTEALLLALTSGFCSAVGPHSASKDKPCINGEKDAALLAEIFQPFILND